MTDALSFDAIVGRARETTGLSDFGEDTWEDGCRRLLAALEDEARLSQTGRGVAAAMLVAQMEARLWVTDWHRRHPEIAEGPITAPVFILGQPRTGTTILFDLLAQDPQFRVPLTWEVTTPNPPPETATYDTDPRIAEGQLRAEFSELMLPGFQAIHPSGPLRGQECVAITSGDFKSMLYSTTFRVPSYGRWLQDEADLASAYRYHRRFLQLLQWRHPGSPWLLKSPAHQWSLPALFAEYPDARIIHTHRDPLKVIASTASLAAHLHRVATDESSIPEEAAEWVEYLVEGNDRSVTAREDGTVPPSQAVDLAFADLMADPFAAVRGVYEHLGLTHTDEAEQRMRRFLADNPSDKHGVHAYSFSETLLDADDVRRRTRRYEEYFAVPRERLT